MTDANLLTLHCNIQCSTCQFRITLSKESSELLRTQCASWLKRHNCQQSSKCRQYRQMLIFVIEQQLISWLIISRQLLRKLSLMWSHSLIIFIYKNVNTTAMLISSYYLKADTISLWIKNE